MAEGTARYACENGNWFLKLAGDLRHPLGPALNSLLDRAFADPQSRQFVIDLREAENIDSTCLGILARIGNEASRHGAAKPTLVSSNADINEVLLAVCFDRMFNLVGDLNITGADMEPIPAVASDSAGMLALVLEAHRRLCAIDERTHETFRDVVRALEEDVERRNG